jgi:hypothetical protein
MPILASTDRREHRDGRSHRRRSATFALLAVAVEAVALWLRTSRIGGRVVVRCRDGHLFTTIWIPGVSVKALRLVWWRFQRCPVGHHWSLVTPVRESSLSEDERRHAREEHDLQVP